MALKLKISLKNKVKAFKNVMADNITEAGAAPDAGLTAGSKEGEGIMQFEGKPVSSGSVRILSSLHRTSLTASMEKRKIPTPSTII